MSSLKVVSLLCVLLIFSEAEAKNRAKNQRSRIGQGVRSGELNRMETKALVKDRIDIKKMRNEARADGRVSKDEAMEIQLTRRENSKDIYREKHDAEKRGK